MNRGLKKTMGIWFTLILGGLVIFSGFGPVQPAEAATLGEIVTQADQGLGAKQDLQTIVKNAVKEGMASNLGLAELCAAIGETVMNAGYQADPQWSLCPGRADHLRHVTGFDRGRVGTD